MKRVILAFIGAMLFGSVWEVNDFFKQIREALSHPGLPTQATREIKLQAWGYGVALGIGALWGLGSLWWAFLPRPIDQAKIRRVVVSLLVGCAFTLVSLLCWFSAIDVVWRGMPMMFLGIGGMSGNSCMLRYPHLLLNITFWSTPCLLALVIRDKLKK